MNLFTLQPIETVLLIVDVQEKLLQCVDRGSEVLYSLCKLVRGFQILQLPILLSEQYPEGLGQTVAPLRDMLGESYQPFIKTSFSCLDGSNGLIRTLPSYQQWIVVGLEAHICVLQTVKSLLKEGKQVTVLNDAITSRSIYDFSTAIAEMRDLGTRISSVETVLFELIKDSTHPQFKAISHLVKTCQCAAR